MKAQIQMFETIAILFIFFVFIGLGFIFYAFVQTSSLEKEASQGNVLRGIQVVEMVSRLPEVQCSRDNVAEENCIDLYKARATANHLEENALYYYPIFGYSNVTFTKLYPDDGEDVSVTLYSRKKAGNMQVTHIPISLYEPAKSQYYFGILRVEVFS